MNKRKKIRVVVWHGKQKMQVVRAREVVLTIQPLGLLAPYRARRAWAPFKAPLKPGNCLPLVALHLVPEKGAGKKATGKNGFKKTGAGYCFIGIGHKEPRGRGRCGVRAEFSKRSNLAVWSSMVYVKLKLIQGHCIEDTAGFAGGGDAGGQAGGKARSTEA